MLLLYILGFSLLGSVGALGGAALLLLFPRIHQRMRSPLLAYAVGSLLGAAFLALLPKALELGGIGEMLGVTLVAILGFFAIEKVLRIPHGHGHGHGHSGDPPGLHPAGWLILVGDAFHNFVDGVIIATSFLVSIPLGIMTALAVATHEVPQELGDFVILLESGWEKRRALLMNALSSLTTVVGALAAYGASGIVQAYIPYFLAIAAASFIYIAATDLTPMLHHERGLKRSLEQALFVSLGVITLWALERLGG